MHTLSFFPGYPLSWEQAEKANKYFVVFEGGNSYIYLCRERVSSGKKIYTTDEFWFLTDPEQFVYFCLASKPEWQLLKQPWELSKFVNVPQFTKYYFGCGLTLTSQHAAILKSHNGQSNRQSKQFSIAQ